MDKKVLAQLVGQGMTIRQIGQKLHTSYTNVRYWLRKFSLKTNVGLRWSKEAKLRCHCSACGETDSTKFYGHRVGMCGKCYNNYIIKQGRQKKMRIVRLLGGACKLCGYNKCLASLTVHHKDPQKKDVGWNHYRSWSWSRIKRELKKCILVCANCHGEIHSKAGVVQWPGASPVRRTT